MKRAREPLSLHACITTGQRSSSQNRYGQAVKAQFCRSKFLTAVADVSTGPIGVTTPCNESHLESESATEIEDAVPTDVEDGEEHSLRYKILLLATLLLVALAS